MAGTRTLKDESGQKEVEIYGFPTDQGRPAADRLYAEIHLIDPTFKGTYQDALALQMSQNPGAQVPGTGRPGGTLDDIAPLPGVQPTPGGGLDAAAPMPGTVEDGPRTNVTGLMGAAARGAAPATVGAGLGLLAQTALTALGTASTTVPLLPAIGAATMALGEPVTWILNKVFGTNFESPAQGLSRLLTSMGVEEADSQAEMLVEQGVRTGSDFVAAFAPALTAGAATVAASRSPIAAPGATESLLSQAGRVVGGPAVAGEVAGEFGAEGGGRATRGAAEAVGVQNPVLLDTVESLGRLGGGMLFGGLTEGLLEGNRLVNEATNLRDLRSRTPESAATRTPLTRSELDPDLTTTQRGERFQQLGEGMSGGTGEIRFRRYWENVQELKGIVGRYGVEVDDLGHIPDNVSAPLLDDFLSTRREKLTQYTGLRDSAAAQIPDGPVPTTSAQEYLEEQFAELGRRDTNVSRRLQQKIVEWQEAIKDRDFDTLNRTRRDLRQELKSSENEVIRDQGSQMLDEAYRRVTADMEDYARSAAGDEIADQWATANRELRLMAGDLNDSALSAIIEQGVLNPDNVTPEAVADLLFSRRRSDVEKLYRSLSEEGQSVARQALISRMAQSQDFNDLSPTQFAKSVEDYGTQLGVFMTEDEVAQLAGAKKWFDMTRRSEQVARAGSRPQGLPTSALPGAGTLQSMAVRGNPAVGLASSIVGLTGLGKLSRVIEQSPQIKEMFKELADLSPGSDSAMRLGRIITLALEDAVVESEPPPEPVGRGASRSY